MDDDDRQPGPLRIVKRSSNAPIRPTGSGSPRGSGSDPDQHPRRASAATEETMDSIQEDPGVPQRSLSIPKKRRSLNSRMDEGASRFYTASEARAAGMARRRRNRTDSIDSGSDRGDTRLRDFEYEAGGRYASVRAQYLRDGQRAGNLVNDMHSSRPSSSHSSRRLYEDEGVMDNFQRMRLSSEDGGASLNDDRRLHQDYYESQESIRGQNASDERFFWPSDRPDEFGRRTSVLSTASGRRGPYEHLPPHPQSHAYDSRPMSTSDILLTGPDLFPPEPYARPCTTVPFNSSYKSHRPSESFHSRQMDPSRGRLDRRLSQIMGKPEAPAEIDPHILVPIVSVTPECRTVEGNVNSFWVAIELFAHITHPLDTGPSRDYRFRQDYRQASASSLTSEDDQGLQRFGYISGMDIKILSSYQSEILEVIGKSPSLLTLLPGSKRLMIVHVHLDTSKKKQPMDYQRYRPLSHSSTSEQLLEDLELQLGSTSQEYMQIQLTYSHSGFPKRDVGRDPTDRDGGYVEVRTTIETTVTALVMQQNSSSMWSPSAAPPAGSPLVDIVAKHWGSEAAKEMAKRIATSIEMRMLRRADKTFRTWDAAARHANDQAENTRPSTPENGTLDGAQDSTLEEVTPRATSHSQQLPLKKTERQDKGKHHERNVSFGQGQGQDQQPTIPARLPKKENRQSSRNVMHRSASTMVSQKRASHSQVPRLSSSSANIPTDSDTPSPGCLLPLSKNTRLASGGPRQAIPDAAPRNIRRPVGMDTMNLQNMTPSASEQSLKSENCDDRMADYGGFRSSSRSSTISKRSGKWPWPGWFS